MANLVLTTVSYVPIHYRTGSLVLVLQSPQSVVEVVGFAL